MADADSIELPFIKPVVPTAIQPTARPTTMFAFFEKGEPKSLVRMMIRNPRPACPIHNMVRKINCDIEIKII